VTCEILVADIRLFQLDFASLSALEPDIPQVPTPSLDTRTVLSAAT
jgi:hypothetical protein